MTQQILAQFPEKLQCLFTAKRYKVLYGGRGAGRSWGVARALLLIGKMKPIRVLCARELQNSIEESVHKVLSDQITNLGLDDFYRVELKKIYGANGTTFSFEGIKNNVNKIKSYEGIDYCWVEEANKVTRSSWSTLVPTIRKEQSEIWMTFNPELETDYTYSRFVKDPSPDSIVVKMSWRDNYWFPEVLRREMEEDKKRDYDHYLNIWEGNTVQHLEGAVYAKELRAAALENRICSVPYEREIPVNTYWDLGRADNTAIWFIQRVAMQWRILAYYEASQQELVHFLRECQRRPYVYDTFVLPHDAKHKRLGYKHSIEELVRNAGYKTFIAPPLSKVDGINAVRLVLPNCYFDESECEDGLNALRHYRYKVKDGKLSNEPLHDHASDGADAFRYFAVSTRAPRNNENVRVIERLKRAASQWVEKAPNLGWMQ
jgi:phage terminase large subunit